MGAGEIMILVLRDYVYFSHHKTDHNFFLTHRILLRMEVNHPEVCILVVSKAQLLAIPLAKDNGGPRFFFVGKTKMKNHKNSKISRKLVQNQKTSMKIHKIVPNQRKS